MSETLSKYLKRYVLLESRISAFSTSTKQKNDFQTLLSGFIGVGHIDMGKFLARNLGTDINCILLLFLLLLF